MDKILSIVRFLGLLIGAAGWAASLHFMFQRGGNNPSALLMAAFAAWVSLPFMVLLFLERKCSSWKTPARLFIYALIEFIAILSGVVYSGLIPFEGRPNAFPFLVVPCISLLVIGMAYLAIRRMNV